MCTCTHTHMCTYRCSHTHTHTLTRALTQVCAYTQILTCTHALPHTRVPIHTYTEGKRERERLQPRRSPPCPLQLFCLTWPRKKLRLQEEERLHSAGQHQGSSHHKTKHRSGWCAVPWLSAHLVPAPGCGLHHETKNKQHHVTRLGSSVGTALVAQEW